MSAPAVRFDAVAMPASVCVALHEAIEAGKLPTSLVVHWRDKGATVTDRGTLSGHLRRAGRHAWAQKILRADVPTGRVLVFVDVKRGANATLATLPKRPAPVVAGPIVAPAPEPVLVASRQRARVPRVRSRASGQYLRDLEAITRAPGIPRGRTAPHA